MEDVLNTSTAALAALTMAIVAAVRKQIPVIDGAWVFPLALDVAAGLVILTAPFTDWRTYLTKVGFVFAAAVGTNALASNMVEKAKALPKPAAP